MSDDQIIQTKKRRLNLLRLEQAKRGIGTDPAILMEIDDLEKEIAQLQRAAAATPAASTSQGSSPPATTSPPATSSTPPVQETILVTLRLTPTDTGANIGWEGNIFGNQVSAFRMPFQGAGLLAVIKALDAVQRPEYPDIGNDFSADEQALLSQLGYWAGGRVVNDIHKQIGKTLYQAFTADQKAQIALSNARNQAITQGKTLSYVLRIPPEAVELAALPWEMMRDDAGPLLLTQRQQAHFVRYLELAQALPPASPPGQQLRILALSPKAGIKPEQRAAERQARDEAWADLKGSGRVVVEELEGTTIGELTDRIDNGPPIDILHFYGHGRYLNNEGALLFDAPGNGRRWIGAQQLASLLGDTRLIMLHACQSAMVTPSESGLLTGVAPALSAAGVPVVVAMQLTVRMDAATRMAEKVYTSLARGESVQQAVSRARRALYVEEGDGASWYVPTLTIRSSDLGPLYMVRPA